MVPDDPTSTRSSKSIITFPVRRFLKHESREPFFSAATNLLPQGKYGRLVVYTQQGQPRTIYFHTDSLSKPRWLAIISPKTQYDSKKAGGIPAYFEYPHTEATCDFAFFDLSDFQGRGTGDETWAQKSGVVVGDKRVGPDGYYINHGWERYQDVKLFPFKASINNAKV